MPIDPTYNSSISRIGGQKNTTSSRETRATSASQAPAATSAPTASTQVRRLDAADTRQDIDATRVAEIRQGIADGTLTFDSGRIADGLLASARELANDGSAG